jgi:hypothetical protein
VAVEYCTITVYLHPSPQPDYNIFACSLAQPPSIKSS